MNAYIWATQSGIHSQTGVVEGGGSVRSKTRIRAARRRRGARECPVEFCVETPDGSLQRTRRSLLQVHAGFFSGGLGPATLVRFRRLTAFNNMQMNGARTSAKDEQTRGLRHFNRRSIHGFPTSASLSYFLHQVLDVGRFHRSAAHKYTT